MKRLLSLMLTLLLTAGAAAALREGGGHGA